MKAFDLLGLGRKGNRVVSGHAACLERLRNREACLVLLAGDASDSTRRRFQKLAKKWGLPWRVVGSQRELGEALGMSPRSVVVVLDENLAVGILRHLEPLPTDPDRQETEWEG